MNKINYDKVMQDEISKINEKKRLLLHSCCAPCSSACIERLKEHFSLTIFYYNPNMDSEKEYILRRDEQVRYCKKVDIDYILEDYNKQEYLEVISGLENEKEGGARCEECFLLRLKKTAEKAKQLDFDYFATTLTVSPLKNSALINEIGLKLEKELGIKYLPSDFKKQGGYLKSISLSKENNLYRQSYCGCEFSKKDK